MSTQPLKCDSCHLIILNAPKLDMGQLEGCFVQCQDCTVKATSAFFNIQEALQVIKGELAKLT